MELLVSDTIVETLLANRQVRLVDSGAQSDCFAVRWNVENYYQSAASNQSLLYIVLLSKNDVGVGCSVAVAPFSDELSQAITTSDNFDELVAHYELSVFDLSGPLFLQPVSISKPWGQEIWYTGIEARGVSLFSGGGCSIPIHWLLEAFPNTLVGGQHRNLNLLKILDPLPEEVYGDLYFELHEQKQEVYVVTHVDQNAWPEGEGAIRFGFDPAVRAKYADDEAFLQDFRKAVKEYEVVRRQIDDIVDQCREQQSIGRNEPISATRLQAMLESVPASLSGQEKVLREAMNAYTGMRRLRVGDVVRVPTHTPHALQHGVRTVEFQTPVYERKIVSFAQKVLTQAHWDTDEAIALMSLDTPPQAPLNVIDQQGASIVDEVVRFDDFQVRRLTLAAGDSWQIPVDDAYLLVMSVNGGVELAGMPLAAEQAVLVPKTASNGSVKSVGESPAIILIAEPI